MLVQKSSFARRLPLIAVVLGALIGGYALRDQISFATLQANRDTLLALRDARYGLTVAGFMAAYALLVAFSLPGAALATLTGGFLFGLFPGVIYNVLAATCGAIAVFLAARAGLGAETSARIAARGGAAARLQARLRDAEWSVLLVMRLLPVVPFFLANLLPAFVGVKLHRYAITTFFGIMPGGLVLTWLGSGLGAVFDAGGTPDLSILTAPQVLAPMLALSALACLPVAVTYWRARQGGQRGGGNGADQG